MTPPLPPGLHAIYEPLRELGSGGMGVVWLARDRRLDRLVAIKTHFARDSRNLQRFQREAEVMARLSHPNLVRIFDFGSEEGQAYLVMEHLEGQDLGDLRRSCPEKRLPPERLFPLVLQIATGLEAIHQAGLVHRDLKESNVLVTGERAVIVDFGLAFQAERTRLTRDQDLVGTVPYLAPELLEGNHPGPGSDWFALGVLTYRCLEGRFPWTQEQVLAGVRSWPPEVTTLRSREPWRQALEGLLTREPGERPETLEELKEILRGRRRPPSPPPAPPGTGRGWAPGLLALLVLALAPWAWWSSRTAPLPPPAPDPVEAPPPSPAPPPVSRLEHLGDQVDRLVRDLHDPEGLTPGCPERLSRNDRIRFLFRRWGRPESMVALAAFQRELEAVLGEIRRRDPSLGSPENRSLLLEKLFPALEAFARDRYVLTVRAKVRLVLAFSEESTVDEFHANLVEEETVFRKIGEIRELFAPLLRDLESFADGPGEPWILLGLRARLASFLGTRTEGLERLTADLLQRLEGAPPASDNELRRIGLTLLETVGSGLGEAPRQRLLEETVPTLLQARNPAERVGQRIRWIHCWLVLLRDHPAASRRADQVRARALLGEVEAKWEVNPGDVARYAYWANGTLTLFSSMSGRGGTSMGDLAPRLYQLQKQASLRLGDANF